MRILLALFFLAYTNFLFAASWCNQTVTDNNTLTLLNDNESLHIFDETTDGTNYYISAIITQKPYNVKYPAIIKMDSDFNLLQFKTYADNATDIGLGQIQFSNNNLFLFVGNFSKYSSLKPTYKYYNIYKLDTDLNITDAKEITIDTDYLDSLNAFKVIDGIIFLQTRFKRDLNHNITIVIDNNLNPILFVSYYNGNEFKKIYNVLTDGTYYYLFLQNYIIKTDLNLSVIKEVFYKFSNSRTDYKYPLSVSLENGKIYSTWTDEKSTIFLVIDADTLEIIQAKKMEDYVNTDVTGFSSNGLNNFKQYNSKFYIPMGKTDKYNNYDWKFIVLDSDLNKEAEYSFDSAYVIDNFTLETNYDKFDWFGNCINSDALCLTYSYKNNITFIKNEIPSTNSNICHDISTLPKNSYFRFFNSANLTLDNDSKYALYEEISDNDSRYLSFYSENITDSMFFTDNLTSETTDYDEYIY